MDKIEKYREILQAVVKRHAGFQSANGQIQTVAVADREADEYMVIDTGWNEKESRIHDVVLHFRLRNGKVSVENDGTDAEIVRELMAGGISPNDIILAFNAAPYQRLNDLIAA